MKSEHEIRERLQMLLGRLEDADEEPEYMTGYHDALLWVLEAEEESDG